jgi:hypothetical protein
MGLDESTVRKLSDELEIRNLLARVHNITDGRGTRDEYLSCWTEDCIWESAEFGTWRGHAGHLEKYAAVLEKAREVGIEDEGDGTYHMLTTVEVQLDGDTAVARSKWIFLTTQDTLARLHLAGTYDDQLRRTPDGWKLVHRLVRHRTPPKAEDWRFQEVLPEV